LGYIERRHHQVCSFGCGNPEQEVPLVAEELWFRFDIAPSNHFDMPERAALKSVCPILQCFDSFD
jgi:hypothetical protein